MKRFLYIALTVIATSIVLMKSCMSMRTADEQAVREFNKAGVPINFSNIDINGRHLHYAKTGNDTFPTIIFVHGSPGNWHDYSKYLLDTDLLKHYRLISIDRPGFGESDYGEPLLLQPQVDIIGKFLEKVQNGKPLYLLGHSYGGPVVSALAADHPQLVSGVVILAGAVDADLEGNGRWRNVMGSALIRYLIPKPMYVSNYEIRDLKKDLQNLQPRLGLVKANVWVMQGTKDMLVDPGNAEYIKQNFRNAHSMHIIYLPKENHFIPWTRFKEVKDLLLTLPSFTN